MGFNTYPALAIRQPDLGRTLAIVAAMKTANFKNQLLLRKLGREEKLRGLTGEAVDEMFQSGGASSLAQGAPSSSAGAAIMASGGLGGPGTPAATSTPAPPAGADPFQGRKAPPAFRTLARNAPGKALDVLNIMKFYDNAEDRERAKLKRTNQKAGALMMQFSDLPEKQKPLLWPQFLRHAKEKLGLDISRAPQRYDPRQFDQFFAEIAGTAQYIKMVDRRERESTIKIQTAKGPIMFKPTPAVKDALALNLEPGTKEFKEYIRKRTFKGTPT